MIELTKENINELERLQVSGKNTGGDIFVISSQILYKIYDDTNFIDIKEQNIDFLLKTKPIALSGYPIDKIILKETHEFIGFSMPYYHNTQTFTQMCNNDALSFPYKKKIIEDIYAQLKELHKRGILLKDIHMDNFIANESGHIIDLDEFILPGNEYSFRQYYCISKNARRPSIVYPTRISDNIKTIISSLSLIYGYNFEEILRKNENLDEFLEYYKQYFPKLLYEYLELMFNMKELIYFDEVIDYILKDNDIISMEKTRKLI